MPVPFETAIQQVNSAVGTVASLIWNPENTSTTTFGPLGSIPSTATLKDVMIANTGTATMYIGMGSAAAASVTGLAIPPGGQVVAIGYSVLNPTGTAGQIWGQTGTVGYSTSSLAGLATESIAGVI